MQICGLVLDGIADSRRKNVDGQMGLFDVEDNSTDIPTVTLPDIPEFSVSELMAMEHEVTGLYLSGHPMDEYRSAAKNAGAVMIGAVMSDYAKDGGNTIFHDDQKILIAGVVETVKTKPTKTGSLMAYVTLEDGSGSMEILVFQRALDSGGGYLSEGATVMITGRISARDDKEPQLLADTIRPLSDLDLSTSEEGTTSQAKGQTLWVKLPTADDPRYERIKLVLTMFPGKSVMKLYFCDTKKIVGTRCVIHEALIKELQEMLGDENVVIK